MKHQITLRQYRAMDLFMLTALACLGECLITLAATMWFPHEPYVLSVTAAVTAIVMVRWGGFACIPAVLGALVFCAVSRATLPQYLIYCVGNLLALALTQVLYRIGWKRLHENVLLALLYGALTAVLMQCGRALIALALGNAPAVCVGFISTDVLTTLFTALVMWIALRLDGVAEDQRHYLDRIAQEARQTSQPTE